MKCSSPTVDLKTFNLIMGRGEIERLCDHPEFRAIFDGQLDFTPASLGRLDEFISDMEGISPAEIDGLEVVFGVYVGETLRRQIGWQWAQAADRGWHLELPGAFRLTAHPFIKVRRRLTNRHAVSLEAYFYAMLWLGWVQRDLERIFFSQ
jgi:hypothetical protein